MASANFTEQRLSSLHSKLDSWWDVIRDLRVDSSPEEWETFGSYLSPDCTIYFNGMGAPPFKGVQSTTDAMKGLLGYWAIKQRRVLTKTMDLNGRVITANLLNKLSIMGQELDLPEAEFVEFDEQGRILEYKLYVNPAPIMEVIQKKRAGQ